MFWVMPLFLLQVWRLLFVTEPCFDETGCFCPISKVVVLLLECEVEQQVPFVSSLRFDEYFTV